MVILFFTFAALMVGVALAFVLLPLRRAKPATAADPRLAALEQAHQAGVLDADEYARKRAAIAPGAPETAPVRSPAARATAWALLIGVPLLAVLLYWRIGTFEALQPHDAPPAPASGPALSMEQAIGGLAERLRSAPDDLEGWMLLGRAYKSQERFALARDAFANAYRLTPEDPDVLVEYAEARVLASESRRFEGEPLRMLQQALEFDSQHARALWLLGISHYQREEYASAASTWERLLAALPADAEALDSLRERVLEARARAAGADGTPVAEAVEVPQRAEQHPAPAAGAGSLTVRVEVAPELSAQIAASDVLFVFARAVQGSRVPVAIRRLPAGALPATVVLDDSTSMMPELKLSTMQEVVVGARISRSGQAVPQPGDLEGLSEPVSTAQSATVDLTISRIVP